MNIFSTSQAQYYCSNFQNNIGDSENSIGEFFRNRISNTTRIIEGASLFNEFRDCSLREVERNLFLAVSNYRRSLDLMMESASPWALITIYYSNFFSAKSLLGMFGCVIINRKVIDVSNGNPGQQELRVRSINSLSTFSGPHRKFWDLFYQAVTPLRPIIRGNKNICLNPISNDPVWLIERRNEINYDSRSSINLSVDFAQNFSKENFPNSLPGIMQTQFGYLESILDLAFFLANSFQLSSDALVSLKGLYSLRENIKTLIYNKKVPGLVRKTRKQIFN